MDVRLVLGLILAVIVGFFAWQWYSKSRQNKAVIAPLVPVQEYVPPAPPSPPRTPSPPEVAGQTAEELSQKEPLQQEVPQEAITHEGHGPADFDSNLRHPEQSFHQPGNISMTVSDVPSGRAVAQSSPQPGEQGFSPEMAQNDGPIVGNTYAFDGMEPTGFATF